MPKFLSSTEHNGDIIDINNNSGTAGQILSSLGAGNGIDWIDQGDVVASEADKAKSVILRVKNSTASPMTKGQVVCEAVSATPPSGNLIEVALADNNGTNTMPALGILNEDLDAAGGANDEGDAIMFGKVSGIDTSAFSVGDEVFVDDTPGGLTTTKPTGVKYIQKVGVVIRDDASNGTIEVFGAGRVNDVPTPLYIDHPNQRVGIGATLPGAKLDVSGAGNFSGGTVVSGIDTNTSVGISIQKGDYIYSNDGNYLRKLIGQQSGGSIDIGQQGTSLIADINFLPGTSGNIRFFGSGSEDMRVASTGNVGIGTTSPSGKLNIVAGDNGTALFLEAQDGANTWKNITFKTYVSEAQAANLPDGSHIYTTSPGVATTWPFTEYGALVIEGRDNTNSGIALRTGGGAGQVTRIAIREGGNVGIGTTSPNEKLTVAGQIQVTDSGAQARLNLNNTGTGDSQVNFQLNNTSVFSLGVDNSDGDKFKITGGSGAIGSNDRFVIDSSGNIGIGTTNPTELLHIAATNAPTIKFSPTSPPADFAIDGKIQTNSGFLTWSNVTTGIIGSRWQYTGIPIPGRGDTYINLHDTNGIDIIVKDSQVIKIEDGGDFGINTTAPSQKLHVVGNARVTGAYYDSTNSPGTSGQILSSTATGTDWIDGSAIPGVPDGSGTANYTARWIDTDTLGTGVLYDNGTNVGIGTTNPNQKLTIKGTDQYVAAEQTNYLWGNSVTIGVRMGTDSTAGLIDFRRWTGTATTHGTALITQVNSDGGYGLDFRVDTKTSNTVATTSRMFLSQSGEVGIGTTSPSKLLEIKGGNNEAVLRLFNDQANTWDIQNSTDGKLDFIRGGSNTYMRIDQFGHVGIGVTSHSFLLDIGDSRNDRDVFRVNGSNADVLFSGNVDAPTGGVGLWNFINTGTNATTRFYVQDANNSNDRLTFRFTGNGGSNEILSGTSLGNVGVGTTSPGEKLDVAGDIKSTGSIYTGYDSGVTNSISCSNWFRTSGNTGIFFATYGGGLYMTDSTYVTVYNDKAFEVNNTSTSSIRAAGDIVAYYSDERLKTNLGNITNAIDKVKKLNGFYYKNNELANSFGYTEDHLQVGVSAQEVEAVMPEAVKPAPFDLKNKENGESYSATGENYKTVKYEKLVPLLIEAIKEQQKQIDKLKNQLDAFTK